MADIAYSLETLTGKHGALLEVVEAIVVEKLREQAGLDLLSRGQIWGKSSAT